MMKKIGLVLLLTILVAGFFWKKPMEGVVAYYLQNTLPSPLVYESIEFKTPFRFSLKSLAWEYASNRLESTSSDHTWQVHLSPLSIELHNEFSSIRIKLRESLAKRLSDAAENVPLYFETGALDLVLGMDGSLQKADLRAQAPEAPEIKHIQALYANESFEVYVNRILRLKSKWVLKK